MSTQFDLLAVLPKIAERQTPSREQLQADQPDEPLQPFDPRFLRFDPVQGRSKKRFIELVTTIEEMLAHPLIGRDGFTTSALITVLKAKVAAGVSTEKSWSIGTIYRYFEDIAAMLDYVWPDRGTGMFAPREASEQITAVFARRTDSKRVAS